MQAIKNCITSDSSSWVADSIHLGSERVIWNGVTKDQREGVGGR